MGPWWGHYQQTFFAREAEKAAGSEEKILGAMSCGCIADVTTVCKRDGEGELRKSQKGRRKVEDGDEVRRTAHVYIYSIQPENHDKHHEI